jgi:hypothetical protein
VCAEKHYPISMIRTIKKKKKKMMEKHLLHNKDTVIQNFKKIIVLELEHWFSLDLSPTEQILPEKLHLSLILDTNIWSKIYYPRVRKFTRE